MSRVTGIAVSGICPVATRCTVLGMSRFPIDAFGGGSEAVFKDELELQVGR